MEKDNLKRIMNDWVQILKREPSNYQIACVNITRDLIDYINDSDIKRIYRRIIKYETG